MTEFTVYSRFGQGKGQEQCMDNTTLPVSVREQWPWQPRFARVNGWRMHYVDEGTGDPIVLLHRNPTWGFLYRDSLNP